MEEAASLAPGFRFVEKVFLADILSSIVDALYWLIHLQAAPVAHQRRSEMTTIESRKQVDFLLQVCARQQRHNLDQSP